MMLDQHLGINQKKHPFGLFFRHFESKIFKSMQKCEKLDFDQHLG